MVLNMFRLRSKYFTTYVQGQSPKLGLREYFYFIDHQGMLFLDDARIKNFTSCFKDKQFLVFFFKRLRKNNTGKYYPEFPYISLCGRERNFVRCDDYPIVFTHVIKASDTEMFCHNHAGDLLKVPFQPNKIYMCPESGRIYHPAPDHIGSIGLIQSKLAIEFSKLFTFKDVQSETEPTHFTWNEIKYELDQDWFNKVKLSC